MVVNAVTSSTLVLVWTYTCMDVCTYLYIYMHVYARICVYVLAFIITWLPVCACYCTPPHSWRNRVKTIHYINRWDVTRVIQQPDFTMWWMTYCRQRLFYNENLNTILLSHKNATVVFNFSGHVSTIYGNRISGDSETSYGAIIVVFLSEFVKMFMKVPVGKCRPNVV